MTSNHPKYDVAKDYARGVYYASQYVYDSSKWAVYSPTGVCLSLYDSKREAVEEVVRLAELQQPRKSATLINGR